VGFACRINDQENSMMKQIHRSFPALTDKRTDFPIKSCG